MNYPHAKNYHSWSSYVEAYLESLAIRNYSEQTIDTNRYRLSDFTEWANARELYDPKLINRQVLEQYQKALYRYRKANGEPLSVQSQHGYLISLKMLFKWLAREGIIRYSPANDMQLPKLPKRIPQEVLSVDEVQTLFKYQDTSTPQGLRNRAMMELMYCTGIRRKEVAMLRLADVNLSQLVLFVREGKGGDQRLLPLSESVAVWLHRYLREARELLINNHDEQAFFTDNKGKAAPPHFISKMIASSLKTSGLRTKGAAHLLRHSCATHLLDNGADIRIIQEILGHKSIESTQIYTSVAIKRLREVHRKAHPSG